MYWYMYLILVGNVKYWYLYEGKIKYEKIERGIMWWNNFKFWLYRKRRKHIGAKGKWAQYIRRWKREEKVTTHAIIMSRYTKIEMCFASWNILTMIQNMSNVAQRLNFVCLLRSVPYKIYSNPKLCHQCLNFKKIKKEKYKYVP